MADCAHSWTCAGSRLELDTILDDWLGPTLALVSCADCKTPALLHLVAWRGTHLSQRIFAVRTVEPATRDTYLANINRDYCDLARKTSETEALINACCRNARLVLVAWPDPAVEATSSELFNPPVVPWQDIKAEMYDDWIQHILQPNRTGQGDCLQP